MADEKKIIVDDDWKAQARAEKEKLSQEAQKAPPPGEAGAPGSPPPASFSSLVAMIVDNIAMSLGGVEDPRTRQPYVDLVMAKQFIDLLSVLEDKTRNNLTPEEKKLLDEALYKTRMLYVQIAQQVSQI